MRTVTATIIAGLLTVSLAHAGEPTRSEEQKTLYAIGASVAKSLAVFTLSQAELDLVIQGVKETLAGEKAPFEVSAYSPRIQELAKARRKTLGESQSAAGREFVARAAAEKGAVRTASGMVYLSLSEGTGAAPLASDTVKVNYRGSLVDGKEFDSSYKRGKPLEFKLDSVIKCWTEGVQKMKPGGKAKLVCPATTAYGDNGVGDTILPGATLAFEVELLEVTKTPTQPAPESAPTAAKGKPATPAAK